MDPRDGDDEAEAAVPAGAGPGAGEDASSAEECVPPAVVSGDRDREGTAEEQASGSPLALSGERGCEEAAAAAEAEEADASAAVAGDGGVLAEGSPERRGHEGDEEEDGYMTPTSPRHRLSEPKLCPPAPRARSEPMALPARRLMLLAASASPSGPRGRKRILADLCAKVSDDLASAFVLRRLQRRL